MTLREQISELLTYIKRLVGDLDSWRSNTRKLSRQLDVAGYHEPPEGPACWVVPSYCSACGNFKHESPCFSDQRPGPRVDLSDIEARVEAHAQGSTYAVEDIERDFNRMLNHIRSIERREDSNA